MTDRILQRLQEIVQVDVGKRGLANGPQNIFTTLQFDFANACRSISEHANPRLVVVTGFKIIHAQPPAFETDGPLGALYLARMFANLGIHTTILAEPECAEAMRIACRKENLSLNIAIHSLVMDADLWPNFLEVGWRPFLDREKITHVIAIERAGPNHTLESLQKQFISGESIGETYLDFMHAVPESRQNRYHNMKGDDITAHMAPAHLLFESIQGNSAQITTIGIIDGGNEIGSGKIPWSLIRRTIPGGDMIACHVPTDLVIPAGTSNWGAYALTAGVLFLKSQHMIKDLFDIAMEERILHSLVNDGGLVDGMSRMRTPTVDGLSRADYYRPFEEFRKLLADIES